MPQLGVRKVSDTVKMLAIGAEMENLWPALSNKTKETIKQKAGKNSIFTNISGSI